MDIIVLLLICAAIGFGIWLFFKYFKVPKTGCVSLVTGGVKSGKTTFALQLARKNLASRQRKVWFINIFRRLFRKPLLEKPLFYSNIKHTFEYVPLTADLLLRKKRFNKGSVVFISEASLVADSMCWKDENINEALMLFCKLCGHELGPGGKVVIDTQSISDLHYQFERNLSEYYYVHRTISWIPFFLISFVRELKYSADGSTLNVFEDDVEDTLRPLIIPKRRWKEFDAWCYSIMTDDLPVVNETTRSQNLKVRRPLRFREIVPKCYKGGSKPNEKKSS